MLSSYFTGTITAIVQVVDKWGTVTGEVETGIPCRLDWRYRLVMNELGQTVPSELSAYIPTESTALVVPGTVVIVDGLRRKVISKHQLQSFSVDGWEVRIS